MSEPITSPGDKQLPKEWWLEKACRIAAFRLRQQRYMSANTVPSASRSVIPLSSSASSGRRSQSTSETTSHDESQPRQPAQQYMALSSLPDRGRYAYLPARSGRHLQAGLSQSRLRKKLCMEGAEQGQALARTASLQRSTVIRCLPAQRFCSRLGPYGTDRDTQEAAGVRVSGEAIYPSNTIPTQSR